MAGSEVVGEQLHFDAGVRNAGNADSDTFNVKWLVDGAEVGAYGSHAGVRSGSTVLDGNSQFTHTFAHQGSHTVSFVVDADNHIAESGEEDNTDSIQVSVTGAPASRHGDPMQDLMVDCVLPSIPVVGGPAHLSDELRSLVEQGKYQEALQRVEQELTPDLTRQFQKFLLDKYTQGRQCRALWEEFNGPFEPLPGQGSPADPPVQEGATCYSDIEGRNPVGVVRNGQCVQDPSPGQAGSTPPGNSGGYRLPCVLADGSQGEIDNATGACGRPH